MTAIVDGGQRAVGDADAFNAWVSPHLSAMVGLASRLVPASDAEDVVQDALERAWSRWSTFDESRGSALGWLLAVVKDQARRRRTRSQPPTLSLHEVNTTFYDEQSDFVLEHAIATLAIRQRLAINLYYYLGLDIRTCAEVMGCAEGTVKATLHKARLRLHTVIGEEEAND